MEYVITNPAKWRETKLLYQITWSDTDEYKEVARVLREIDWMIPVWARYKHQVNRRQPLNERIKWAKLEKEYCICINGLLEHCGKMVFWIRLQQR